MPPGANTLGPHCAVSACSLPRQSAWSPSLVTAGRSFITCPTGAEASVSQVVRVHRSGSEEPGGLCVRSGRGLLRRHRDPEGLVPPLEKLLDVKELTGLTLSVEPTQIGRAHV